MRKILLVVTFMSFAAWSQPAQQQTQPPIPVRIEMPPESVWIMLLKVILPTILGATLGSGITLYGIRQNNKHNAVENAANREHQLKVEIAKADIAAKYRSQDNRWAFRKDVYVNLLNDTTSLIRFYANYRLTHADAQLVDSANTEAVLRVEREKLEHWRELRTVTDALMNHFYLARLATADEVFGSLERATGDLLSSPDLYSLDTEALTRKIAAYGEFRRLLCDAGRKDLWGTPELEGKADDEKEV
jgi:hypothetical protein